MSIEIKSIFGDKLFVSDAATLRAALREAVLRDTALRNAELPDADLQNADLRGADLREADLRRANLRRANLRSANLREANLREADLREADLREADLRIADLQGADLQGADLREADLRRANLRGADLRGAKNINLIIAKTRILPDEGEIIGWKKAQHNRLVKLCIPADARRSHAFGRKCRAERAEVIAIFDEAGNPADTASSLWDGKFHYEVGAIVEPTTPFDPDMWNECSSGIHFYITRLEAENHV